MLLQWSSWPNTLARPIFRFTEPNHRKTNTVYLQHPFEPVVTFRNSQGEAARGTITSLQRRSLVMEVYNPYSIVQVSEVLSDLTIRSGTHTIYRGKAVVVSLMNTGLMAVVSVALIDEWSELGVYGAGQARIGDEARQFVDGWMERFRISEGYMVAVGKIRAFLAEVARWTDQADLSSSLPRTEGGSLRSDVFMELATPVITAAADYFADLECEIASVIDVDQDGSRRFAQNAIHPLILRAPFVYRTFAKPLGYAGDYEMVNQILSDVQQGPSTYFQIINALFLASPVAEAHRNRIDILERSMARAAEEAAAAGRVHSVLNIGCGPAQEIERFIRCGKNLDRLRFKLIDFSQETLDYTRDRLNKAMADVGQRVDIEFHQDSVHNLLKRASKETQDPAQASFDFVYCAGLFDYLSDKVCARLLEYLKARTRPGGRILVTNVHSSNRQRGVMEHLLEWHLIYRDEAGMVSILPSPRQPEQIYTDPTGVNVFAEFLTPEH